MLVTIVVAILIAALVIAAFPSILSGVVMAILAIVDRPRAGKR